MLASSVLPAAGQLRPRVCCGGRSWPARAARSQLLFPCSPAPLPAARALAPPPPPAGRGAEPPAGPGPAARRPAPVPLQGAPVPHRAGWAGLAGRSLCGPLCLASSPLHFQLGSACLTSLACAPHPPGRAVQGGRAQRAEHDRADAQGGVPPPGGRLAGERQRVQRAAAGACVCSPACCSAHGWHQRAAAGAQQPACC